MSDISFAFYALGITSIAIGVIMLAATGHPVWAAIILLAAGVAACAWGACHD